MVVVIGSLNIGDHLVFLLISPLLVATANNSTLNLLKKKI